MAHHNLLLNQKPKSLKSEAVQRHDSNFRGGYLNLKEDKERTERIRRERQEKLNKISAEKRKELEYLLNFLESIKDLEMSKIQEKFRDSCYGHYTRVKAYHSGMKYMSNSGEYDWRYNENALDKIIQWFPENSNFEILRHDWKKLIDNIYEYELQVKRLEEERKRQEYEQYWLKRKQEEQNRKNEIKEEMKRTNHIGNIINGIIDGIFDLIS